MLINLKDKQTWKQARKDLAECLKRGKLLQTEEGFKFPAFMLIGCILLAILFLVVFAGSAHAYTYDQLVTAIGKAENSKAHPYGIMVKYAHTSPRQACINTIRHQYRNWLVQGRPGSFLPYLAKSYAPIGANNNPLWLNVNWLKNVQYWLAKGA